MGRQTRDLFALLVVDVGQHVVRSLHFQVSHHPTKVQSTGKTHRRHLLWQIHVLGNRLLALQRARLVKIRHLLAQVDAEVDQLDQAVLDLDIDVRALADGVAESALGFDDEL